MKKSVILITFLFAALGGSLCLSQDTSKDSIRIESEYLQDDDSYYDNKYMYLDINLSDDHKLLKLGIQPFKPNDNFNMAVFMIHGGFEQKLNSSFSFVNELNAIMLWSVGDAFHQLGYSPGLRYYFTKKREMAQGKSGDNCNGPYLLFRMSELFSFYTVKGVSPDAEPGEDSDELYRGPQLSVKPEIGIGIQQKIRRQLYFDANMYCNYDFTGDGFGYGITFLFGGLLSFTN
jgi:hypothetical protein